MARSQCSYCGSTGKCLPGCDGPCCGGGSGGGGGGKKDPPKVPKHKHIFKRHIRRHNPADGSRPWDEWGCTYPGCTATEERKV